METKKVVDQRKEDLDQGLGTSENLEEDAKSIFKALKAQNFQLTVSQIIENMFASSGNLHLQFFLTYSQNNDSYVTVYRLSCWQAKC